MKLVGLTGSIGMGKTTAAQMLRRMGLPVFDADAEVHRLLGPKGGAVAAVEAAFPGTRQDNGAIDRRALGSRVFGDKAALERLEAILHPKVAEARRRFIAAQRRTGTDIVILDVPLLFEVGGERECDAVLVVSAPPAIQRQRVLSRPGMTTEKFHNILANQMPDRQKRRYTPYVVETGLGKRYTLKKLNEYIAEIRGLPERSEGAGA